MTILIRKAVIVDPFSPFHQKTMDLLIRDGIIETIATNIKITADQVIEIAGLHVSPGWFDPFAHFCDPGLEQKETIETGIAAAATGGFTEVMLVPNTQPVINGKAQVHYILKKAKDLPVLVHPLGTVTKNAEGKEIAEMYDMQNEGAKAFTDGWSPVQSAGLLLKALQYVKAFNGTIIQVPDDRSIGTYGLVNEGKISTQMGLPGKPMLAEIIAIEKDIRLAAYAQSSLHITGVTTAEGLTKIKEAKKLGVQVSCSVAPYHVYFSDADLQEYDTNLKVFPPLRTTSETTSLKQALIDGTIDCISAHHRPHEWDSKTCEFEYAQYGMESLESCYGAFGAAMGEALTPERWVTVAAINPRKIFGMEVPQIAEGKSVNVTLFDPAATYTFEKEMIRSKSANNAFLGKTLRGKVWGIIQNHHIHLNK